MYVSQECSKKERRRKVKESKAGLLRFEQFEPEDLLI